MNYKIVGLLFSMGISFLNCSYAQTNVDDNFNAKRKILAEEQKIFFKQCARYQCFEKTVFLFSLIVVAGSGQEVFNAKESLSVCSKEFVNAVFKGGIKGGCIALPVVVLMNVINATACNYIMK